MIHLLCTISHFNTDIGQYEVFCLNEWGKEANSRIDKLSPPRYIRGCKLLRPSFCSPSQLAERLSP